MRRSPMAALAFALAVLKATPVLAQQPVVDFQAVVQAKKQMEQLLKQSEQLGELYAKQIEQLAVSGDQLKALVGSRGIGDLLNDEQSQAARRLLPPTLETLLRSAAEGRLPGSYDELAGILTRIQRELELAGRAEIYGPDAESPVARAYERTQRTTLATLAVSDQAYQGAAQRVESYEELIQAINGTEDLKASSDLVARLLAENGLATNELIRLQALQLSALSAEQAALLATRGNLAEISRFDADAYERLVQRDPEAFAAWDERE